MIQLHMFVCDEWKWIGGLVCEIETEFAIHLNE